MNFIFLLLIIVLVSNLCLSKPYYGGPGYNNDRENENAVAASSHQKKRLLPDDAPQMQEASSMYDASNRYRKYQASADAPYVRRDHDQSDFDAEGKERREFYDNNNAKDSSIEVILDPRAKKAVAVVENSPTGQAMYDLSGWKNNANDNQDNQEQIVNLVYPAERSANDKMQRKYNAETYDGGKFAENYEGGSNSDFSVQKRERIVDSNEQLTKKKRNVEMAKSQNNVENAKVDNNPVKRSIGTEKRKADQSAKMVEKQSDCPPHNSPQNSDSKNVNQNSIQEVKRQTQQWSQEQMTAVQNSLMKANEDISEMTNLKLMLSDMGLIDNTQKRDTNDKELENEKESVETKREIQSSESNEEDELSQDEGMLKRNDRAITDDEKWELDVNSAPQEPVEKRETKDEKESAERKRSNEDIISNEDTDSDSTAFEINDREKRQNDKKEDINTKDIEKLENAPAANSENLIDNNLNKRDTDETTKKEKRKFLDADFDKQMESQIQAKIDAIKEKVKREILEDQKRKRAKRFTYSNYPGDSYNYKPYFRSRRNANLENINTAYDDKSFKMNARRKRANIVPEKQMVYQPFQTEQDDEAELDGDFEDNKQYLQKRQTADDDFQYFDSRSREYPPYAQGYYPQPRNRRSFENDYDDDNASFHDSGMINNKAAVKNREKFRDSLADQDSPNSNELNDNEYFGSLPVSYNGELTRYKRVKRDDPYN